MSEIRIELVDNDGRVYGVMSHDLPEHVRYEGPTLQVTLNQYQAEMFTHFIDRESAISIAEMIEDLP